MLDASLSGGAFIYTILEEEEEIDQSEKETMFQVPL